MDKPDWQVKFERFLAEYPSRLTPRGVYVKLGKYGAEMWFRAHFRVKLDEELYTWIMSSLRQYRKATDSRYVKDMDRWLKGYGWQDFDKPKVAVKLPPEIAATVVEIARKMDCRPALTPEQEFEESRRRNLAALRVDKP